MKPTYNADAPLARLDFLQPLKTRFTARSLSRRAQARPKTRPKTRLKTGPNGRKRQRITKTPSTTSVLAKTARLLRMARHVHVAHLIQKIDYQVRCLYYRTPLYPFMEGEVEAPVAPSYRAPDLWPGDVRHGKSIMAGHFTFFDRSHNMGKTMNWSPQGVYPPWLEKLHDFGWLADLRATHDHQAQIIARDAISDWIANCGKFHPVYWHPYPLSSRLCHWLIHSGWLMEGADSGWQATFMESLVRQANHLPKVLEWDMGGFRLIKNLKAQIFVSLCLPSRQSAFLEAEDLLKKELEKQILPDGAHHERSPSAHAEVLKDLLDIHAMIIKAGQTPPEILDRTIDSMSIALAFYRHPDGHLALFNGSFAGDVDTLDAIQERCGLAETIPSELTYAGYGRLDCGAMSLIFDAGQVAPQEGSVLTHADTLSFEFSYREQRVFINSGSRGYHHPKNTPFRQTDAHNTLSLAHQSSAEVSGKGYVGRRPERIRFNIGHEPGTGLGVEARHDGYRHLGALHTRRIFLNTQGNDLRGEDIIEGQKNKHVPVQAHFHLHPHVRYQLLSNTEVALTLPDNSKLIFKVKGGQIYDSDCQYCPGGDTPQENRKLVVRGAWQKDKCVINWGIRLKHEGENT